MCEGKRVSQVYTPFEVAKHCTEEDCWVIIDGKVYDVTQYVPRHPGGAMIYVKAGGDCTHLFEAYHPPRVRALLGKYQIGELQQTETLTRYEQQGEEDKFYVALKKDVYSYFVENKLNPRFSISMYVKAAAIILTIAVSAYVAFFGTESYAIAMAASVVLGFAMAEVGVSIQHDANHGAFSHNPWVCHIAGLTLDAVGASSFMWKQQHVVGHHVFTNVHAEDPDIRVKPDGADVRRVTPWQPHSAHHSLQHLYLGALYSLLAFKSIFVDDFSSLSSGRIGAVEVTRMRGHEVVTFWAGKVLFAAWWLVAPLVWSAWNIPQLFGLWAVCLAFTGWTLAFMFQVAHVVDEVEYLQKDSSGKIAGGWAEQQLATSADFCHGSPFWTHVSGGLNYQVVHHLFPGVLHTHYPAIAPIIKKHAAKAGIKYRVFPTFLSALYAHFKHLHHMGSLAVTPSLHTIG